ncbi:MAG: hypothetical protein GXX96_09560 [Planctomycetaceae bacterium]|nr:hypothetical protein [Planctomycetaceae bacterium]
MLSEASQPRLFRLALIRLFAALCAAFVDYEVELMVIAGVRQPTSVSISNCGHKKLPRPVRLPNALCLPERMLVNSDSAIKNLASRIKEHSGPKLLLFNVWEIVFDLNASPWPELRLVQLTHTVDVAFLGGTFCSRATDLNYEVDQP